MQRDALVDRMNEMRLQHFDARGDVRHHVLEIETRVGARHDNLAQLYVTGRTPREHARRTGAGESGHRIAADLSRCLGVAGSILNDTATIGGTCKNFVARAETSQNFE